MSSKLPVALLLTAVLVASVAAPTIPASNALIQRDFSYLNDNHLTVRTGDTKVCGDHLCAPGEWDKLQAAINAAQLGNKTAGNITSATTTQPAPSNSVVCTMVKGILNDYDVSSSTVQKVMSDLGC
ncbi:MAG: hypothetical protein KGI33_05890 [Thaumarchaeota archaeon]|nr:hypothetical protein [Nitrososphaerota archaeon]